MVVRLSNADRRKALRSLTQRGFVVHVGALETLYLTYDSIGQGTFSDFLDKTVDLLGRPNGAKDGIITKDLASSVGERLRRQSDRKDGVGAATVEVIDAFSIPIWRPESVAASNLGSAGIKLQAPTAPIIDATADAKAAMFRSRYELVLSKTLRNPRFKPPSINSVTLGTKSPYFQLTGIESLAGSKGEKLVLAMLTQLEEGSWSLEDVNGTVKVDLSEASITPGLHTECSFVVAQGTLLEEEGEEPIFQVSAMGSPPSETREDSLVALGIDANLFGGQFDSSESVELLQMEEEASDVSFMIVSDVALDNSRVMAGLRHVFRGYLEDEFIPTVIILMGNFLSHPFGQQVDDITTLEEKFGELGEMISTEFKPLAEECTFILVPGTNDPGPGNVIPRPPLPKMITRRFVETLGSEHIHLTTNPCRIRYLTQEIVVLRDDMMQKMVRHCSVKPDIGASGSLSEHLIKTLVDQAYLSPLPASARPVLWNHDHALWLFPTPHMVVVADRIDSYICEYGGSLGLNPGSFSTDFSFQIYLPAQKRAQQCSIESEDVRGNENDHVQKTEHEEGIEVSNPPMAGQLIETESDREKEDPYQYPQEESNDAVEGSDLEEERLPQSENVVAHMEAEEHLQEQKQDRKHGPRFGSPSDAMGDIENNGDHLSNEEDEVESDEIESDDESMLIPAEGIKRLDIKALVRSSFATDESHARPDSESGDE